MPKIASFYTNTMSSGWCRETFNGNIIVNGTYHDAVTLAPRLQRFDWSGDSITGSNNLQTQAASGAVYEPRSFFQMRGLAGAMNWNMPYGSCWYYASGYGKAQTSLRDNTVHQRQYYLNLGKWEFNTWTGSLPGWGYVAHLGNTPSSSVMIYDDSIEDARMNYSFSGQGLQGGFLFANVPVAGTAVNANVQAPSFNSIGQVYRWCYSPHMTANGTVGGTTTTSGFNFAPNQTTVGAYTPIRVDNITAHNAVTTTTIGTSSAARHLHLLTFTSNLVYFVEHTLSSSAGTGTENTTNVFFVKKMTYAGVETAILSLPQWMYGLKLPTQMINETNNTANVIIPYFNTVTANVSYGNLSLLRLDISKVLNSESVSLMTITNSPGQRMYNVAGIQNTITGVSTYNDIYWRYHSVARTWIVNGVGGQNYLMLSFENTGYSLASYNNNSNLTTQPSVIYAQTALNDNAQITRRNEFFRIWAFTLDANYTSAVYQAETDFGNNYPRWYYPLRSDGMIQYMSCMDNTTTDRVIRFNESTYKWDLVATMPYRADMIGQDSYGRIYVSSTYGAHPTTGHGLTSLYIEGNALPQTVTIAPYSSTYTYSGANISTNISVSTTNIFGNLVAANVLVSLSGGMAFATGATSSYVATSSSAPVTVNTTVTSTAPISITGTITGYI